MCGSNTANPIKLMKRIFFGDGDRAPPPFRRPAGKARTDVSVDFFYDNPRLRAELGGGRRLRVLLATERGEYEQFGLPFSMAMAGPTPMSVDLVSYEDFGWATYHYGRCRPAGTGGWFWGCRAANGTGLPSWRTAAIMSASGAAATRGAAGRAGL